MITFRRCSHDSGVCLGDGVDDWVLHRATRYVIRDDEWDGTMCCDNERHVAYAVRPLVGGT